MFPLGGQAGPCFVLCFWNGPGGGPCASVPHRPHAFTRRWACGWFARLGGCQECCKEQGRVWVSFKERVSGHTPRDGMAVSQGRGSLRRSRSAPPHWCPEWLCQRTRPPTLEEGALCATPTAASVLGRLATDGHSPRCEVVPRQQFGFALLDTRHTRGGEHGLGHVLLGHLHILWGERSFRVFGPFVEWAVAFVGP